ncbi:Taurine dioxygenase, alpha-ketoglutarate-dependent [Novosphingobium sp. CF614]|uniref:TauD/TfdA dioxygenase family protein n=1 Tax=Novosphingobium sp. CF614 TaxID=1884364 RepID=UPI0008F2F867|nr:TauD/TfdA family dioxygenase [Novosphingobium sp. CF614]SFG49003.1 Taurine dioxygenase, alpha-ketoglutarate-dependent [Novosphingobium sp. CF614]
MTDLQVRNLRPEFGAEITGLDPVAPLDPAVVRQLRGLFRERGLLVFPNLNPDARFQTYLAEQLVDERTIDPDALHVDELHQVSNVEKIAAVPLGRLMFHSDTMWEEDGCKAISLFGKVVEPGAIPTMFVSIAHAWNTLPEGLRARVQGRFAIHCSDATDQRDTYVSDDVMVVDFGSKQRLRLPIAYPHPRTGQTVLYVSPQLTHHIEGFDHHESEPLLNALFDHMYAEQNVFTYNWRQGDLVVWDNLAIQHARPDLRADAPARTLRKTLVPAYMVEAATAPTFKATYKRFGD